MEEIKRIDRKLIAKGSIIDYYHDIMLLPDGSTTEYDLVSHKGAAAVRPVLSDGRIVMVRQYRNALERYTVEIPAGGLNEGEETKEAAARELSEETGYITDNLKLLLKLKTTVAFCNENIDIYVAHDLKPGKTHPDEGEYVDTKIYTLDELVDMIYSFKIQDSKTISAILAYKNKISM